MGYEEAASSLLSRAFVDTAELSRYSSEAFTQHTSGITWETVPNLAGRFAYAVTPSLIRNYMNAESKPAPKEPRSTAWMDGLRGITALIVFNKHYLFAFTDMTVMPWGANSHHYYLVEAPIIRLAYSGSSALNFFFAVAGYVVSIKSLQLMSTPNSQTKLFNSLASSTFRGIFRLFLTVAAITFIWSVLAYLGAFEPLRPYIEDERQTYFPGIWAEGNVKRFPTFKLQLAIWWHEMRRLTNVFSLKNAYSELDPHLWTTILQFRAQMHIYFVLLATSRLRESVRLFAFAAFLFLYLTWDRWEIALYMAGVIIAQLQVFRDKRAAKSQSSPLPQTEKEASDHQLPTVQPQSLPQTQPLHRRSQSLSTSRQSHPPPPPNANTARPRLSTPQPSPPASSFRFPTLNLTLTHLAARLLTAALFTLSLYLLSYANLSYKYPSPGFEFLNPWIPSWFSWRSKFWPGVGTCLMLYLLTKTDRRSWWQWVLNHWFPQYLGRVMFAMVSLSFPSRSALQIPPLPFLQQVNTVNPTCMHLVPPSNSLYLSIRLTIRFRR